MTTTLLRPIAIALLSIASLSMWFVLGFPWDHHNESLVWAVQLQKTTLADTFVSNPITTVQSYRPLGVALAWATFHATGNGIWLQQLVNYVITAAAWIFALYSVKERVAFAGFSFLCAAAYFSGYIYLFHLHGVFYGPLFLYLAWLLCFASKAPLLDVKTGMTLLVFSVLAGLFHTFAFLFFAAFLIGLWIQNSAEGRNPNTAVAIAGLVAVGIAVKVLTASSSDLGTASPLQGLLVSYRALEVNAIVAALSAVLTIGTAFLWATSMRERLVFSTAATVLVMLLLVAKVPLIVAWIAVCCIKAMMLRRWALAALVAICGILPGITATGSPTYALFMLMPCAVSSVIGVVLAGSVQMWSRVAAAVALATLGLCAVLKVGIHVPGISGTANKILAEQEKTRQMHAAFVWLDQQRELTGNLELCQPGDFPIRSTNTIERTFRAPTHAWPFDEYIKARYGERLRQATPKLRLCFGGEELPDSQVLYRIPGQWAGAAAIELVKAPLAAHADLKHRSSGDQ
jgi:hypothetical protein